MAPEASGPGQTDDVAALLAQAQADFAALRLTAPAGGNALQKYRKVLELAPDNAAAKQGLQGIADRFASLAQQTTAAGDLNEASEYLQQALAIAPTRPTSHGRRTSWHSSRPRRNARRRRTRRNRIRPRRRCARPMRRWQRTAPVGTGPTGGGA